MAYKYRNFTVEITLQHITMVKICQHLWQQSDVVEKIKSMMYPNRRPELEIIHYVISKKLDKLILPTAMKIDLNFYLESMGMKMLRWLGQSLKSIGHADSYEEQMAHYITHLSWDHFGSVDGKRMVESYVSKKPAIDYSTWHQLCYYCSEIYIKKFSGDITWTDCKENGEIYPLFWYYKIHGNFPEDYQFPFSLSELPPRLRNISLNQVEGLNDKKITQILLFESMRQGNTWSSKYCWNQQDDVMKREIQHSSEFIPRLVAICTDYSAICLQFVGQMSDEQFANFLIRSFWYKGVDLMDWPWIFCIRSWKNIFTCCDNNNERFWHLTFNSLSIMNAECGKNCKGSLYQQHRQVVSELWESNYGKTFANLHPPTALVICSRVVRLKDIKLCQLIFAGESERRKQLLTRLSRYLHFSELGGLEDDFWTDFMVKVLVNDDEREYFKGCFN